MRQKNSNRLSLGILVGCLVPMVSCSEKQSEYSSIQRAPEEAASSGRLSVSSTTKRMLAAASARLLSTAPGTVFIHPDHLGSTTLVTGSAGSIQGTRRFEPEGAISAEEGTLDVYGFTGQETDLGTELLHFKSRTLDLVSGRWLSSDPLFGVSSTEHFSKLGEFSNLYAYVAGRMINSYDSTGLLTVFVQANRKTHGSKTEKGMAQAGHDVRPVPRKGSPRNRQIKTAAFIGHTSYNDGDRTQRFALPDKKTGKFDQVSPEVAAMRVMETFPKIETVVIMGCHASAQDQKGGSFIERMAAKFAEQGKVGVKVIGAAGVDECFLPWIYRAFMFVMGITILITNNAKKTPLSTSGLGNSNPTKPAANQDTEIDPIIQCAVTAAILYIDKRKDRIRYAEARAQALPIGSGAVESTCKSSVNM